MTVSGIHDFNELQSGFPIKIASGMTICESIEIAWTLRNKNTEKSLRRAVNKKNHRIQDVLCDLCVL